MTDEVVSCPRCDQPMRPAMVKTAIWRDDRLFVVEDIPAQVCDSCMEQFYDDDTTEALRRLTEQSFSSIPPEREALVPVFSLKGRISRRASASDEPQVDY